MSHGFELNPSGGQPPLPLPKVLTPVDSLLRWVNRLVMGTSMLALLLASAILTASVFLRYFLHVPTDWQDEAAVFLLVGATFLCGAHVQAQRGHVGIEAVSSLLPEGVNRVRKAFCDLVSFAFCTFFSWKSWTLFHEAYVDGQTTSSSWAPPLAIPYGLMATGMSLLALQLLLQFVAGCSAKEGQK